MTSFITRAQQLAAVEALGFDPKHITRVEIGWENVTVQQNATVGGRTQAGDNGAALQTVTVHPVVGGTDDLPADTSTSDAIHRMFGLSYSNYLVVERTLLQSMPATWQAKFVVLLAEFEDAFAHIDRAGSFIVVPAEESVYGDLTDEQRTQHGLRDDSDSEPGDVTLSTTVTASSTKPTNASSSHGPAATRSRTTTAAEPISSRRAPRMCRRLAGCRPAGACPDFSPQRRPSRHATGWCSTPRTFPAPLAASFTTR